MQAHTTPKEFEIQALCKHVIGMIQTIREDFVNSIMDKFVEFESITAEEVRKMSYQEKREYINTNYLNNSIGDTLI